MTGRVVERTANHTIGVYGDIVVTYAFRGTVDDTRHITATEALVFAEAPLAGGSVRVLFVLAEASVTKPPSAVVRAAMQRSLERLDARVSKAAIVVVGEGFGAAIHRALIGGMLSLRSAPGRTRVVADVQGALEHLLRPGEPGAEVLRFCERELSAPA